MNSRTSFRVLATVSVLAGAIALGSVAKAQDASSGGTTTGTDSSSPSPGNGVYTVLKKHSSQPEQKPLPQAEPKAEEPTTIGEKSAPKLPDSTITNGGDSANGEDKTGQKSWDGTESTPNDKQSTPPNDSTTETKSTNDSSSPADSAQTATANTPPRDRIEDILGRRHGEEQLTKLRHRLEQMQTGEDDRGMGASSASIRFDNAGPRAGADADPSQGTGTNFFSGHSSYQLMPVAEARTATRDYGGIPGGVVLEGRGPDLSDVEEIGYDPRYNAVVLDGHRIYVFPVPPKLVALLCSSIANDEKERVGVSAARPPIVYGAVPDDSPLAWDLLLTDEFLGGIVFGSDTFTKGYRFADDFTPEHESNRTYDVAVFFKFTNFNFATDGDELHGLGGELAIQLVPLSDQVAPDGNFVADEAAIRAGKMYPAFATNARHVADHIAYYRREAIVDRAFAYGETAAFVRSLKRAGFDVQAFGRVIDPDL